MMKKTFNRMIQGYRKFRTKYVEGNNPLLNKLATKGQSPEIMIVSCCDSRVDPALLLQCEPGDLFIVRNVANIVPPYENDEAHHGTSAALEFGIRHLNVKHLIVLGHSQCGGIQASMDPTSVAENDFIPNWTKLINITDAKEVDVCAKHSLLHSYKNLMTFPWIKQRINEEKLQVHIWFFDIREGTLYQQNTEHSDISFQPLDAEGNAAFPLKNYQDDNKNGEHV